MSDESIFEPELLRRRVRAKAQRAIAPLMEPGETISAMVPALSTGPEQRRGMMRRRGQRRLIVATPGHVYVFSYRFGRIHDVELKADLGSVGVDAHDGPGGSGLMTVGNLRMQIGGSVWRSWRDGARRLVELNHAAGGTG